VLLGLEECRHGRLLRLFTGGELREAARLRVGRCNRFSHEVNKHASPLHRRMPMAAQLRLCIDGRSQYAWGCLPLQRMPAPIRQRLRACPCR